MNADFRGESEEYRGIRKGLSCDFGDCIFTTTPPRPISAAHFTLKN